MAIYIPPSTVGQPFVFPVAPNTVPPIQPAIVAMTEAYVPPADATTTLAAAIVLPGVQSITPVSMTSIVEGEFLTIDVGANAETIFVNSTTTTSFSADPLHAHPVGAPVYSAGSGTPYVVVTVTPPPVSGRLPVSYYNLYRGPSPQGPWSAVPDAATGPSVFASFVNLYDPAPVFGIQVYYAVTAVDTALNESLFSQAAAFVAVSTQPPGQPLPTGGALSAAAFGPYPLLGTDIYIDPVTLEAVITPGGDLLLVTGLQCLAQDLRIRLLTEPGQLPLHPQFGLTRHGIIGSGQAASRAQAQLLQARIIDALTGPFGEPRVHRVLEILVTPRDPTSWAVDMTIEAIGVEGPTRMNQVFPFMLQ